MHMHWLHRALEIHAPPNFSTIKILFLYLLNFFTRIYRWPSKLFIFFIWFLYLLLLWPPYFLNSTSAPYVFIIISIKLSLAFYICIKSLVPCSPHKYETSVTINEYWDTFSFRSCETWGEEQEVFNCSHQSVLGGNQF